MTNTAAGSAAGGLTLSPTIGMLVLDFTNPFYTEVARAAELVAARSGYLCLLANARGGKDAEEEWLAILEDQQTSGVIVTPAQSDEDYLRGLLDRDLPIVLLDCPAPSQSDGCSVAVDNVLGGELAGQHLLSQGHERIVMLNGPSRIKTCADRREGLERAVERAGLDPAETIVDLVVPAPTSMEGRGSVDMVIASEATAVFCINDQVAIGLMRGLVERDVSIPDGIAVIGYDDSEVAHSLHTPLSTIQQPTSEMASEAVRLLLDEIEGRTHSHKQVMLRPRLVPRESTGG
jgi:LacI family transcriptional regulator